MQGGNAMERQGSQMDSMSGPRSGSPGSGEAPSPKRQRLDGNMQPMQQRPGPPNHQQSHQVGLPTSSNPGTPQMDPAIYAQTEQLLRQKGIDPAQVPPQTFHVLSMQPANNQAKSVEAYSSSIQQHMKSALQKQQGGMTPNAGTGMGGGQGSPMSGLDANAEFYATNGGRGPSLPPNMGMPGQNAANAAAAGQAGANGNHALQDYQMQLMLLEQQNKKRLLMARQEQDSMANPGMPPGPGGFPPGMSPGASGRGGDPSPSALDMRGTPKMNKGMSPNGDLGGRGSPQPGMMNPGMVPEQLRQQMLANGQMMRPPSSHPMGAGGAPLTQEQMMLMRSQAGQMANGNWPQAQGPPMMGQPGQGPPGGPNMTPRQQPMGPPPAPPAGTGPSSPAQPPAPPTPSQATKAKPGTKKGEGKKVGVMLSIHSALPDTDIPQGKKGAQNTSATPASEPEAPPTPTPATPITPMHQNSFNHNQNKNLPNGQQPPNPSQQQPGQPPQNQQQPVQPAPSLIDPPFGNLDPDFGDPSIFGNLDGGDVLDNFDFDSFLNTGDGDQGLGFDANFVSNPMTASLAGCLRWLLTPTLIICRLLAMA